jgi:FSR family fosmidomycin resistance protein-like MFS transporter
LTETTTAETDRFQTGRVLTMSAGHLVHDTYTSFPGALSPVFKATLALSNAEIGLMRVFLQWPSLLQPLIGYLSDHVGLRILFILAPGVTSVMMSLLGIAPSYVILALLLVVAGASSACLHAIGPVMTGRLSGRNLGRAMSFWMVGGELARAAGPLVIIGAVKVLKPEGTPWLMVAGLLTSAVLYVLLRDIPGRPPGVSESLPWRQALRTMRPFLIPLAGIIVTQAFVNSALTTYLPIYLDEGGADLWLVGASLSIFEAAGVVGALLSGSVSDRLGRRSVLFISMLVTPLLLFVFLAVDGWLQFLLLLFMGFTMFSVTPVMMALVQESYPENRALANGLYMAMGFVLRPGVAVIIGALSDRLGLGRAFVAGAIVSLVGLPLLLLLKRKEP